MMFMDIKNGLKMKISVIPNKFMFVYCKLCHTHALILKVVVFKFCYLVWLHIKGNPGIVYSPGHSDI